jgi:hypothetical protein
VEVFPVSGLEDETQHLGTFDSDIRRVLYGDCSCESNQRCACSFRPCGGGVRWDGFCHDPVNRGDLHDTDDPVIVLIACYPNEGPCVTLESVDVNKWSQVRADPDTALERLGWQWYGLGELPYWLTLRDGVIVQVIEQYLP